MKKILFSFLVLFTIFFFNSINKLALIVVLSWSTSFFLPYFLLLVFGVSFALSMKGILRFMPFFIKVLTVFVLSLIPFGIGFALNPIYEGDIALGGRAVKESKMHNSMKDVDLLVITIPNCPFCMESTYKINKLLDRNPSMKISYVICSTEQSAIKQLRQLLHKNISIELAADIQQMVSIAEGFFPCFVKIKEGKAIYKWSNDQFGYFALDKVEQNAYLSNLNHLKC